MNHDDRFVSMQDPRHPYHWTLSLPLPGWAWEFLRRNSSYQRVWAEDAKKCQIDDHGNGLMVVRVPSQNLASKSWGLLPPFGDPDRDARHADILWSPKLYGGVLPIIGMPCNQRPSFTLPFSKSTYRTTVYIEDDSREHILFTQDGRALQLEVTGTPASAGATLYTEIIPPKGQAQSRVRARKRLSDLLRFRELRQSLYRPASQAIRLAQVLQALDGELCGISRRDIAISLFGDARVQRDWNDARHHMRDHIRRAIKRGFDLMSGQYRQLLR